MTDIFVGDDRDYKEIKRLAETGAYMFATCYDIDWGFLLPCKSGVIFEQQTDGVCCHHVYMEGVLIPLRHPIKMTGRGKSLKTDTELLGKLQAANYDGKSTKGIWRDIKEHSHIDFEFTETPIGMPPSQEGFQWILYHGHTEGWGNSFSIESWKDKPIVLIYPNCD